jgi:hypothetical protein
MRGLNLGDIGPNSTVTAENNIFDTLGQDFSATAVYCGNLKLYNNTYTNIQANPSVWLAPAGNPCVPAPTIHEHNNPGSIFGTYGGIGSGITDANIIHE